METLLLDAGAPGAVERAVSLLAAGELVALPTETVYGLAADAARPSSLAAIFQAKERPLFDPLIIHLPDAGWLERLTSVARGQAALVARLTTEFWPGPLTLVLPRRVAAVPDLVTAGGELVAVRMSAHPVFRAVVEGLGQPLAAPSANRFGRISPTTGAHAVSELTGRIPLVLDAGPAAHGLESTVILPDEDGKTIRVLRHGPITAETLASFGRVEAPSSAARQASPGQTTGHYAPRTRLFLTVSGHGAIGPGKVGRLFFRADIPRDSDEEWAAVEYLSAAGDLREAAANLFAALRRLDDAGLDLILADAVPEEGLGRAIMERLRRAAAGSGET